MYKIVNKFINAFRQAVASGCDARGLIVLVDELEKTLYTKVTRDPLKEGEVDANLQD